MVTTSEYQPAKRLGTAVFVTWTVSAAVACWAAMQPESIAASIRGYAHIVSVVTTIIWTHRVYSNLAGLGFGELRFSPTWAGAAYLIPIANLFIPYQVLSEVRNKTTSLLLRHGRSCARSIADRACGHLTSRVRAPNNGLQPTRPALPVGQVDGTQPGVCVQVARSHRSAAILLGYRRIGPCS
jgi:hypothetical protein